jgi:hypothetical protein
VQARKHSTEPLGGNGRHVVSQRAQRLRDAGTLQREAHTQIVVGSNQGRPPNASSSDAQDSAAGRVRVR